MPRNKIRGRILLLSVAGFLGSLLLPGQAAGLAVMGACFLGALVLLYRHMEEMTDVAQGSPKLRTLRAVTLFDFVVVALCILAAVLLETGRLQWTRHGEEAFVVLLVSVLFLFLGNVAPKLPFNRHTGLRLPWTVRDEDTWVVAHRLLGYCSLPLLLLYLGGLAAGLPLGELTVAVLLLWVAIPGVLSYLFFRRKWMV